MKKIALLLSLLCLAAPLRAQNIEGQIVASQYGNWRVDGLSPDSYAFPPTACRVQGGASYFYAFTVGTPIRIVDGSPALSETVRPSAVTDTNQDCAISIAPVNEHQVPFHLTSGTGGLQEALNQNMATPATNSIVLDAAWYVNLLAINIAPATVISTVKGGTQLNLVDVTTTPYSWYRWSTADLRYELVPIGAGGSGSLGTIQGDLLANNSTNTGAVDQNLFVGASPTNGANTISPQQAVNDAAANNGAAIIAPAAAQKAFTNSSGAKVVDLYAGATVRSVMEFGAACDARAPLVTFNASTSIVTIYADYFYTADIGKRFITTGLVGGKPTRFITTIASLVGGGTASSSATVQTAFPFSQATVSPAKLGTLDTAAIQAAFNAAAAHATNYPSQTTLSFPNGNCMSDTIQYTGVSIDTVDPLSSHWWGIPGDDMLTEGDAAANNAVPNYGAQWRMPTMSPDDSIDATQAWQDINEAVTTQHAAVYHPGGILTASSNNPVAPGWFRGAGANGSGAYVGAASVTDGSAVICVPNAITPPPIANKIVFPWLGNGSVFTATVSSNSGSCSAGFTARTLSAAMPTGSTGSVVEWFTGTTPQTINANVSGSTCPTTITVSNPVIPSPASESNVAPQGLFQIDAEQFGYTFRTNAGAPSTQSFSGVTCAQNGTARAAHSSGATVVPLNQFIPSKPWPITPTLNAGSVTPAGAAYYPAWNIGNSAFSAYNSNGNNGQIGLLGFSNAVVNNWTIIPSDGIPHNRTAAMYMVGLPYASDFGNLNFSAEFGIIEATPVTNTGGAFANSQPTADGTRWHGVRINGCHTSDFISGGQNTFRDWNVYSDCYVGGTYVGAGTAYYFTQGWNDETGFAQSIQGNITTDNLYAEPENGTAYGTFPVFEYDISKGVHTNMHVGGGGEFDIGGNNQLFIGGNFNNSNIFPVLNYGPNNGSQDTQLLFSGNGVGNVYGTNPLLSYGPNAHFSGAMSATNPGTAPYGANQQGNSREPWHGQSNETFNTGNTTKPYVNSNSGYIPAAEFNTSFAFEANAFNVPWAYDSALLPDGSPAGGSVGCTVSTDGLAACFTAAWDQSGIKIGPGQRIVAGKYTFFVASHSTGAATSYQIKLGACSLGDTATVTVPVTSAYAVKQFQVDFTTSAAACPNTAALNMDVIYASPAADTITFAFIDFAPVWENVTAQTITVTNINGPGGSTMGCAQSPVTGIQQGYECPTVGWNSNIDAIQNVGDTTIAVDSTTSLPAAGCFAIENEDECYTTKVDATHLGGITRGAYGTTAASHAAGTFPGVISINLAFGAPTIPVKNGLFGSQNILGANTQNPQGHAGASVFSLNNGGNETWVDQQGAIHQTNISQVNTFQGPANFGNHPLSPNIVDSANVTQQNVPASWYTPQTFGVGHMGTLNVIQATTLPAPTIQSAAPAGTTTISYVCSGTDFDGNTVPGSTATITNGAASFAYPYGYSVFCPYVAGINTYQIYRTAGGPSQGLLGSLTGPGAVFNDYGGAATAGSPPASNSSNPSISVAGTGTPCITLGAPGATTTICSAAGAPATTCGTQPTGSGSLYMRTDGAASTSLYSCAGTTWTAVTVP